MATGEDHGALLSLVHEEVRSQAKTFQLAQAAAASDKGERELNMKNRGHHKSAPSPIDLSDVVTSSTGQEKGKYKRRWSSGTSGPISRNDAEALVEGTLPVAGG